MKTSPEIYGYGFLTFLFSFGTQSTSNAHFSFHVKDFHILRSLVHLGTTALCSLQVPDYESFILDTRTSSFAERGVKHWNRLPKEGMESSSLEVFKKRVDVSLGDTV